MTNSISTDRLIGWLNETRKVNPNKNLSDLLRASFCDQGQELEAIFSAEQLVDLACIDLIQQRRQGRDADVESLISQFPAFKSDTHALDLIDAEICIARELEPDCDSKKQEAQYVTRFPHLADQIGELIGLNTGSLGKQINFPVAPQPEFNAEPSAESTAPSLADLPGQGDQSVEISLASEQKTQFQNDIAFAGPIETPEWFVGGDVVASGRSGPGGQSHWLIRGRDAVRRTAIAMKVIKLPTTLSSQQADCILDACEKAAKVKNPAWVSPSVAAIQKQHLAVIRPWEFGTHWESTTDIGKITLRLKQLSMVSFALQAAHRAGAAHGCVHANNIIVCHDGSVRLVDACSSCAGIARWSEKEFQTSDRFWHGDMQELIKLIVADVIDLPGSWSNGLQATIQAIAASESSEACGAIGDELIRRSDAVANGMDSTQPESHFSNHSKRSWRKRLTKWIDGN